jgi:hypothetical protein
MPAGGNLAALQPHHLLKPAKVKLPLKTSSTSELPPKSDNVNFRQISNSAFL